MKKLISWVLKNVENKIFLVWKILVLFSRKVSQFFSVISDFQPLFWPLPYSISDPSCHFTYLGHICFTQKTPDCQYFFCIVLSLLNAHAIFFLSFCCYFKKLWLFVINLLPTHQRCNRKNSVETDPKHTKTNRKTYWYMHG